MQITETNSEGLKRTLKIVLGADELEQRLSERVGEVKDRVQFKGFRRGKVPIQHIRKVYGKALMAEVLDAAVKETSAKAISERKERPALQPDIRFSEDKEEIERAIAGKGDFAYSMSFEVLPEIKVTDLTVLKLERMVAEVEPEAIDKALDGLAERYKTFETEEGRAAEAGDRLKVDFLGKIDGVPFEGGKGEGIDIVIGGGGFIAGFEEGLTGAKAGDKREIKATFPADYPVDTLAGKEATFDAEVKEVARPVKPTLDDEFTKTLGLESLDKLKELLGATIKREYDEASRLKIKRELLDALDKTHDFELPSTLVDQEFELIWSQLMQEMAREGQTFADEGKTEEDVRSQYKTMAQRRVRLGLVLGEIGEKNEIQVTQPELRAALMEQARRFPGEEKMVYEFFEKTPGAVAQLRAPIFENKVVDHILEIVKPAERTVSKDELMKAVEAIKES